MAVRVNFELRRRLEKTLAGGGVMFCYQCGACVGDCPTARYFPEFNPRRIMLKALLGVAEDLVCEDSILWKCSTCYGCYERCPQEVKPVEVIQELKNLAAERGLAPKEIGATVEAIRKTGRSAPVSPLIQKRRKELGLAEMESLDAGELEKLLASPWKGKT